MLTLREARLARYWSIRDLATRADITPRTIVQIEHGRLTPRLVTMRRLASALATEPGAIAEFAAAVRQASTGSQGNNISAS